MGMEKQLKKKLWVAHLAQPKWALPMSKVMSWDFSFRLSPFTTQLPAWPSPLLTLSNGHKDSFIRYGAFGLQN